MDTIGSYQGTSNLSAQILAPPDDQDSCPSDCESGICSSEDDRTRFRILEIGLTRVPEGEMIHQAIAKKLVSSLSASGLNSRVESVHRNRFSSIMGQARVESFAAYSRAAQLKCGGDANVKFAWFGGSKSEIDMIIRHGFGKLPTGGGAQTHGHGIYLYSVNHPIEGVQSALPDDGGLRHMLLCRLILGKTEAIRPGSEQNNPSSEEFDSGVDNVVNPRKYIVWTTRMNTHVLPEFLVSFTASSSYSIGSGIEQLRSKRMPFQNLINVLGKCLPGDALEVIRKHYSDFKKQDMTRWELIQCVRHIAGDRLLIRIMKSWERKMMKA